MKHSMTFSNKFSKSLGNELKLCVWEVRYAYPMRQIDLCKFVLNLISKYLGLSNADPNTLQGSWKLKSSSKQLVPLEIYRRLLSVFLISNRKSPINVFVSQRHTVSASGGDMKNVILKGGEVTESQTFISGLSYLPLPQCLLLWGQSLYTEHTTLQR